MMFAGCTHEYALMRWDGQPGDTPHPGGVPLTSGNGARPDLARVNVCRIPTFGPNGHSDAHEYSCVARSVKKLAATTGAMMPCRRMKRVIATLTDRLVDLERRAAGTDGLIRPAAVVDEFAI